MRECTVCGCDISALQFNRKRCHNPACINKQRQLDCAKRNKSTCKVTGARSQRDFSGLGNLDTQPLQMHTPKPIRSSGGLNVTRDVLDQHKSDEWAWARMRKGVGK
jgi:hypothetical protein